PPLLSKMIRMFVDFHFLLVLMRIAFTFQFEVIYVHRKIEYGHGHDIQTYIAWVERLIIFCYLMAYHAVR
ncbi:hypothetical protein AAHH80_33530, partial [Burkholderia pseudomallei]